ncbi:MAG TPA: FAD-dependent oxidoreductase [Planctomycetaceae bacterium]|nr:FAD-dependent oxidoreductase [Planctomycetaceae bacterium]HQZ66236.1 FAD-dependent oxidoreductase [Planctomycetaceae bacterium]HRA87893.1 FAD-dependent oxidoreductase [Planctomycetaceae bacterium]
MDLTSDNPFWATRNGLVATYPPLRNDASCEVVVVGAGITGALVAQRLASDGHGVIVIDRRDICTGSTSASTALLQYEIDIPLVELTDIIGREKAELAYRISHESIDDLTKLVLSINADCGLQRKTSIYLADDRKSAKLLADEARARRSIGLDVSYHNEKAVQSDFGLNGVAALSTQQAASCDPYRLAHALLHDATKRGADVYTSRGEE